MNFHGGAHRDEPEINLIAFIDILLVVVIFLVLTTTYSKYTELKVNLPVADAEAPKQNPREVVVVVGADGRYAVNRRVLEGSSVELLTVALQESADAGRETMVVISADAAAAHQSVINVMDAARRAGLVQITFATQQGNAGRPRTRP
jgi:biopolymer transport protein ExbD